MINKEKLINIIKDYCNDCQEIKAVYLFGSLLTRKFNKNSDIDIALLVNPKLSETEKFKLKLDTAAKLESLLEIEVDVVIFSMASLRLKYQIIKGKLIFERDRSLRIKKEMITIDNYLDMKYFYQVYEKQMGKGFVDG